MLIVTSSAAPFEVLRKTDWSGPVVIVLKDGARVARASIEKLEDRFVVLEYLQPPGGAVRIFADLARDLPHLLRNADGPIIFIDRPFDADWLADEARLAAINPNEVVTNARSDGSAETLRLGEAIATSPLLPVFLGKFGKQDRDLTFFERIRSALQWNSV